MTADPSLAPAVAVIHLDHLRHNTRVLRDRAGAAALVGVVKADAYGHGAPRVVEVLQQEGVHRFAVATVPEAVRLREAGVDDPVQVFGSPLPAYLPTYAQFDLGVTVSSRAVAEAVAETARTTGRLRVHLKVDTGMGRIGVSPEEAGAVVRLLEAAPGVTLESLWTHFATADEEDDAFVETQWDRFEQAVAPYRDAVPYLHAANSAALLRRPEAFTASERMWVRAGIALYGLTALEGLAEAAGLRPVMQLNARVMQVKAVDAGTPISYGRRWEAPHPTRIATIGAGYADGYPRLLTNRAEVGLGGRRYRVAGTVCMDMFMVDLGAPDGPGAAVTAGDEAVLFGPGGPTTDEVARWAQTIPYEICCGIAPRVPRRYTTASADRPTG